MQSSISYITKPCLFNVLDCPFSSVKQKDQHMKILEVHCKTNHNWIIIHSVLAACALC